MQIKGFCEAFNHLKSEALKIRIFDDFKVYTDSCHSNYSEIRFGLFEYEKKQMANSNLKSFWSDKSRNEDIY